MAVNLSSNMTFGGGLSIGNSTFTPAALFTGGEQGVWYDPSDFSTLYQDSVGTTPVTAVEQPVGLMLDNSQGLVLGSELVTNGDFSNGTTGWVFAAGSSLIDGVAVLGASTNIRQDGFTFVSGKVYEIAFDVTSYVAGALTTSLVLGGTTVSYTQNPPSVGRNVVRLMSTGNTRFQFATNSAGNISIDNISVRELPGNHAKQATSAARPILRARYNLLTFSEQFDNGAWTGIGLLAFGSGSTANATTAPDGTTTADLIVEDTATAAPRILQSATFTTGTSYVFSCYAKQGPGNTRYLQLVLPSGIVSGGYANFDIVNGVTGNLGGTGVTSSISLIGNGWFRASVAFTTIGGGGGTPTIVMIDDFSDARLESYTGDGTSGIYVWGAQLVSADDNTAIQGQYQRIAAATDYDSDLTKFPPYLAFDGVDDSMATASIDLSVTDKIFVSVGITKLSDAATGTVIDQNGVVATAAFMMRAPSGAVANYAFFSAGTTGFLGAISVGYAAPITNVVSVIGNISGDQEILRVDGAQVAINTGDQGTGNYSNLPIYIGRRQGTSLPLNGRIYSLIVRGRLMLPSELTATEQYVASKTGVTL